MKNDSALKARAHAVLQALTSKVRGVRGCVVSTEDGFEVAAQGQGSPARLSAMASSMAALHLAAMELATGRSDMVITGGIDTFNDIFRYMCFSKTPALSPTGEIAPFSDTADGTLLGEGIGMCVLKRLSDAERDNDP